MLLASVLAIGAAAFAGCGDTDCPADITNGGSCSSAGLLCDAAAGMCSCDGTRWSCVFNDMPAPPLRDLSTPRDLTPESD